MKYITIQEAYGQKFKRQKKIKQLRYHALGTCAHIGELSPGCARCFLEGAMGQSLPVGVKCNADCLYCREDKNVKVFCEDNIQEAKKLIFRDFQRLSDPNTSLPAFNFSGGGEPLLYFDFIKDIVKYLHKLSKHFKVNPWLYLYTNGILANKDMLLKLRDLGFNEIRFHLGATNFSKKVYENMKVAVKCLKTVTVETPAWPPHRKQLFKMLPIIEDIGVKHLNMGEIEIRKSNFNSIIEAFPEAQLYPCRKIHLYDGGLVYDIMEEVLQKKYSYSVLDCNCFVRMINRSDLKEFFSNDLEGLFASKN